MAEVVNLKDYFKVNETKSQSSKPDLKNRKTTLSVGNKILTYPPKNNPIESYSESTFNSSVKNEVLIEKNKSKNIFSNIFDIIKNYFNNKLKRNDNYPFNDNNYLITSKIDSSNLIRADKLESIIDFILKGGSGKVEELGYYDTGYTIGDFIEASKGNDTNKQTDLIQVDNLENQSTGMAGILELYFEDRLCAENFIDQYSNKFLYESLGSVIYDYCKYFHSPSDSEDERVCKELGTPKSYNRSEIEEIIIPEHKSNKFRTNGDVYIRLSNCIPLLAFLDGTDLDQFETEENMKETLFQTANKGHVSPSMINFLIYEVGTYFHMKNLGESLSKAVGSLDFSIQEDLPEQIEIPYLRLIE